jgi:hypothetical protein
MSDMNLNNQMQAKKSAIREMILRQKLNQISRPSLAKRLDVKQCTVRTSMKIPSIPGVRDTPTVYQIPDVIVHLKNLNDGKDVWSEQFLSTGKTAALLSIRFGRSFSVNGLIKRRKTGSGPEWVYVTAGTIRYRVEDVYNWEG